MRALALVWQYRGFALRVCLPIYGSAAPITSDRLREAAPRRSAHPDRPLRAEHVDPVVNFARGGKLTDSGAAWQRQHS